MIRQSVTPRKDFGKKLESIGLSFHSWDNYWKEDVCYSFTSEQIDTIEEVTEELHSMCIQAVKYVIDNNRLGDLGIPPLFWDEIISSFDRNDPTLYGRFDLAYDGVNPPKMLEYNADTPTSLLESAVAQWYWMEDVFPEKDQFNSLHDKLVSQWDMLPKDAVIHVASLKENEEDWVCTMYLVDTIETSGRKAVHMYIEDIGIDNSTKEFVDLDGTPIKHLFKLYPWEWMMREEFGQSTIASSTKFIEPMWKAVLSCKGILPILWELFPDHPNLLPAYFESDKLTSYAKKPLYSREGANVELVFNDVQIAADDGPYGSEGYIYQELFTLPNFDGKYPIIGSWIVGDKAAGICIREDSKMITTNMSNFVPHYFSEA